MSDRDAKVVQLTPNPARPERSNVRACNMTPAEVARVLASLGRKDR